MTEQQTLSNSTGHKINLEQLMSHVYTRYALNKIFIMREK